MFQQEFQLPLLSPKMQGKSRTMGNFQPSNSIISCRQLFLSPYSELNCSFSPHVCSSQLERGVEAQRNISKTIQLCWNETAHPCCTAKPPLFCSLYRASPATQSVPGGFALVRRPLRVVATLSIQRTYNNSGQTLEDVAQW